MSRWWRRRGWVAWAGVVVVVMLFILALPGCAFTREADVIDLKAELKCDWQIRCHVYVWQIGIRRVVGLGGTHMNCHCEKPPT